MAAPHPGVPDGSDSEDSIAESEELRLAAEELRRAGIKARAPKINLPTSWKKGALESAIKQLSEEMGIEAGRARDALISCAEDRPPETWEG